MNTQNTQETQPQPIDLEALEGFTPGDWRADKWDYAKGKFDLVVVADTKLATLEWDFDDNPWSLPLKDAEANARLFAAAPRMHAELKAAREREARLIEALRRCRRWVAKAIDRDLYAIVANPKQATRDLARADSLLAELAPNPQP